jgi:hypothetical protein
MSNYKPMITEEPHGTFYALVGRVDADGRFQVIHGYKGRYFRSESAALKSTNKYIRGME